MSRDKKKMVSCGAITSRKLARITHEAELVYWRIYMASDNRGTMSGDPWDVWHMALPGKAGATENRIGECVDELVAVGLLERWTEDDGAVWIHVIGHDKHQSAQYIGRRGKCRTPIPPSLRENSGEPESASADAVVHGSLENSGSLTSTSTSTKASKLAAQPELIRAVDFLVSVHPSIERTREGLLQQLTEFCFGENRPSPQHVLDAALEVGPSIQYPGKAYRLVAARAQSLKQNEPVLSEAPRYVPPPGAEEFRALLAQDEAEGLAS